MSRRDDYNPRFGRDGQYVSKDEFSVDGKSWNYRDPANLTGVRPGTGRPGAYYGPNNYNPNANKAFDPLYDYSYGTVRDAAKELGIKNVDEKDEVAKLTSYISEPRATVSDLEELEKRLAEMDNAMMKQSADDEDVLEDLDEETYTPSKELSAANSLVDETESDILSGLKSSSIFKTAEPEEKANMLSDQYILKLGEQMKPSIQKNIRNANAVLRG